MNKSLYILFVTIGNSGISNEYRRTAFSKEEAIASWMLRHPYTKVVHIEKIEEIEKPVSCQQCKKIRSDKQNRAHHKARITQMRNNTTSLIEDEDAVLTTEERIQLSRVACQLDRILALWTERSFELTKDMK